MKEAPFLERTAIKPESIIGTKWVAWPEFIGDRIKVEFVDKTNCIYTSEPKKFSMTYTVSDGNIIISDVEGPLELRGHILFNNGFPAFEKAA